MRRQNSMDIKLLTLLAISVLVGEVFMSLQSDKKGPYDSVYKLFEDCGSDYAEIKYNTRWRKSTRTSVTIDGSFITNVTITNDIKMRSVMQKLTSNGWKDNFMNLDFGDVGVCDLLEKFYDPNDLKRLAASLSSENGTALGGLCPMPPGQYSLQPFDLHTQQFKGFPVFFYGTYRTRVMFFYKNFDGHEIACALVYFDVVPKRKKNG